MPANYVLLEKITVGAAGASSVTFSGIPQTGYTDLVLKYSSRSNNNLYYGQVYFNGNTTGYTRRLLFGDGSSATSGAYSNEYTLVTNPTNYTANTFANTEVYIPNYASSNYKSYSIDAVVENNATAGIDLFYAALWSNTSAITSITLVPDSSGNFVQYSTFYLYGVAALGTTPAIVPYATGGDTIMTDGTYWYHAFKASGTFTPAKLISCDVLVVAGGGGGGYGGGGAGGYRSTTGLSLSTATTVTVGGGGVGYFANGSNSVFSTITSTGGGGGADSSGGSVPETGKTGGSGGGSYSGTGSRSGGVGNAGSFSPVEGYAGGASSGGRGSGGGGAGAVGGVSSSGIAGAGGAGSNAHSSWASVTGTGVSGYYAGGGGGYDASGNPIPSPGGGGGAGQGAAGTAGTANTGGGGGSPGNNGGSGIVIVRYAV